MRYWSVIAFCCLLFVGACIKTNCDNTTCLNDGVCVQGNCACLAGYEGDDCGQWWSSKYAGSWQASDNYQKDDNKHEYSISIAAYNKDTIKVSNLLDSLSTVYCYRTGVRSFSIIGAASSDSSVVIKEGSANIDETSSIVTGLYSFTLNDSNITTYFTWKQ